MTDALERAARAMFAHNHSEYDALEDACDDLRADYREGARAAIRAFLEADEAMVEQCAVAISAAWQASADCPVEMYARESRKLARAAIAALREMLEEKK